ncbi:MAG TPA: indole-3-glycerol phosphate synthase TrpC [Vicinamibacterales bacterium]|nr:indole-3-glycerol phosphate synthase TrpC [Vicinamibacterales bacterium]
MSASVLQAIMSGARRSALERASRDAGATERAAASTTPRAGEFASALMRPGVQVIAECKRRSPSKGILRPHYDPVRIASGYAAAGAAAISVLTEPSFFDGHLDHLRAVRAAVSLPTLRKDFIATEFQLLEARAAGADAVLLIVAALQRQQFTTLLAAAANVGLMALVEVHTPEEARVALDHGAMLVGVNSRDLQTLAVSTWVFESLAMLIKPGVTWVAESGIRTPEDVRQVGALGYSAVLIGERFMTADDPGATLRQFIAESRAMEAT